VYRTISVQLPKNSYDPAMHIIGAHLSASGGVDKALERAAAIGCGCVQVFSGSPRVWARGDLAKIDTQKIYSKKAELSVAPIFTHALYLLNLASDKPELVTKSVSALVYDLKFDSLVQGAGVIVHLGSHQGRGWGVVREQVATKIAEVLAATPTDSTFLIENSAGQQGKLCSELADIKWLFEQVNSDRLGWCFDTCHGFAAGYSLGEMVGLSSKPQTAAETITELDLWSKLKLVHVNDSRDPFDSGRDRHANLGEGQIPAADLAYFLSQAVPATVPLILEVPGLDGEGPDAENIQRLTTICSAT